MNIKLAVGVFLMACVWGAQGACPTSPGRFVAAGAEVTDSITGLVWARCSVGQVWDGAACSGSATTYTHEQALTLAQATTGWRLPHVKELANLADRGCINPAIDSAAFPNTPRTRYWSSSLYVSNGNFAWNVFFGDGFVGSYIRGNSSAVRLVRASQ